MRKRTGLRIKMVEPTELQRVGQGRRTHVSDVIRELRFGLDSPDPIEREISAKRKDLIVAAGINLSDKNQHYPPGVLSLLEQRLAIAKRLAERSSSENEETTAQRWSGRVAAWKRQIAEGTYPANYQMRK